MTKSRIAIFLSPHFDDVALSCAGSAAQLARMGARCICLTVFAAPAPEGVSLSPFALSLHAQWESDSGQTVQAINDVRREEERQALRLLGLEHIWLDFPDAPYRRASQGQHLYTSDEKLFGKVAPEERHMLVPKIAQEIRRVAAETGERGRVRVFAPLAVGNHVDHQLAFLAARSLPPRYGVLFYEDYPYAGREGALEGRLRALSSVPADLQPMPRLMPISEFIGIKIAAVARYKSQLGVLFGSSEAMPSAVRAYSQGVGASQGLGYAERLWYIPPVYTLVER